MNSVSIVWKSGSPEGTVEVEYGRRVGMKIAEGEGTIEGDRFTIRSSGPCRLDLTFEDVNVGFGSHPTLATIRTRSNPFSFFLRDARSECPIFLPDYGVAVLPGDDSRTYEAVEKAIRAKGLQDSLQKIESEPEESYADAAAHTRSMHVPTWLGLSRDFRIFQVEYALESMEHEIQPQFHGFAVPLKETGDKPVWYRFYFSRGVSCERNISRRLEDGDLPILHGTLTDDDVSYQFATFASPERSALTEKALRGTDYLVADAHGYSNMMTPEQKARLDAVTPAEMNRDEETILWHRVVAVNRSRVPRYAWFKCPYPNGAYHFDGANGFGVFEDGKVFVVAKLDGQPMPKEEVAVMLDPGESATFDFALAHEPISLERAEALAKQKFEARHDECRAFWRGKLAKAAQISLPEKRIEEMLRAGLLHLDLVAYGLEPDQPVAATIGVYCPIGSESSPIIQAMDSFGWRSLAERSLDYFLVKQHDDGFIQNFGGYMLETGAALWSMGEHYRYSHDDEWAKRIAPKVLKSCEFLLNWRERNRREDLRRHGYGMIEGKVADPEDPFRAFMLNGYAYLGLSRASEMLASVDPEESARLKREAEAFKADIRTALFESMTNSPVVPLKDGTWVPSTPPWAEAQGPVSLMTDDQKWFTHGGFTVRDSLLGPIYLILQEVLNPSEPAASAIVRTHADLYHVRNVAPSQPYYSPHALAHLRRGEVKAFLKTYYNGFAGLADRETYDFWEHFFHASPHKTHEEGWFLMQTRWMLWMEDGETLNLLPGIPRAWLKSGQRIVLKNVSTYFGAASLEVESQLDQNRIVARIECDSSRKPERIRLRLPHPLGRKAKHVIGGTYDAKTETIVIAPFNGKAEAILEF